MKKYLLAAAVVIMLAVSLCVGAETVDYLRDVPLNYTSESEISLKFNTADEFVAAVEELTGEELDLDGGGMIATAPFLSSLFDVEGSSVIKADISDDYSKIKLSAESVDYYDVDVNRNLHVNADVKNGIWIDMDISDMTNPKCLLVFSSPSMDKYSYVDVFETMDEETKMTALIVMKMIMNEQFIDSVNERMAVCIEENAEIAYEGNNCTITIDNEGFLNIVDDTIALVFELVKMSVPESAEEIDATEIPSFSELGVQFLGEKGLVWEYKEDGTVIASGDFYIDFNDVFALLGEELPETENKLVLGFTVSETQKMYDVDKTEVTFPELTEENSIDIYDEYFNYDDYYEDEDYYEEYEPEYPNYYIDVYTDYVPFVDGEIYVPFRAVIEDAYDGNVDIAYDNGVITVTSEYFTDLEKLTFTVGQTKANVDGFDFEVGEIILENGVTYVNADFFEVLFDWDLEWATYDYLDNEYNFSYSSYDYSWLD